MKYPGGIDKRKNEKQTVYSNRGMNLENDLNITNEYYRRIDKAYIYKKPTPIKITKVIYSPKTTIKEAFFEMPSTTDYNGLYQGKYIDYEAKETTSKTSFPLKNIHEHQITHIRNIINHQGLSFLIVRFTSFNETYLLLGEDLLLFIEQQSRKSIPYSYFKEKAHLIKDKYEPRVDYLEIIDLIFGGANEIK